MITEDHKDEATARPQETVPNSVPTNSEKTCPSPYFSTSPSSSPSAVKSSTECSVSTSGDESEGITCPPRNGVLGNVTPDGVLTPPTDLESPADPGSSKPLRYNGRLEFYKEGVLCLELSHCEEGQGRKWLKTKGRSNARQIVRVSKEVAIPCSPLPPNQVMSSHPPNGLSSLHDNLSDEGSSAGSSSGSPKSRDKSWRKQPVPQKLISGSLEFFMKPAPCVHALLFAKKRKVSLTELTPRRPYALPQLSLWIRNNLDSHPTVCDCGNPRRRKYFSATTKKSLFRRKPLDRIALRLRLESEKSSSVSKPKTNFKNQSPRSTPFKVQRQYSATGSTSSRKRGSKEIDGHEQEPRTHKRSPTKNLEKMILSVPGVGIGSSLGGVRNLAQAHKPRPVHHGHDATDGKFGESPPNYDHKKYAKSHAGRSSPYSLLRPPAERATKSNDGSPVREAEAEDDSALELEDMLTPEEQQQYAMSRAISYTITSLLSQGPPSLQLDKQTLSNTDIATQSLTNPSGSGKGLTHPDILNPFGTEQDKNSFLRHLLDSSPHPTSTHSSITTSATGLPPPIPVEKSHNQSPDRIPQKARNANKGKRNNKTPYSADSTEPRPGKGRNIPGSGSSGGGDQKAGILNHPLIYGGSGTPPLSTVAPPPPGSPYTPYVLPSPAQVESIKAAAMQYASHLIPPNPRGKFSNHHRDRVQAQVHPPNLYPTGGEDEAPINLSQKDGDWPEVKNKHDRASTRLHVEGRAFPIVPHGNLNEESDPDLPLDLCKKRRDD